MTEPADYHDMEANIRGQVDDVLLSERDQLRAALTRALNALEGMCHQYLGMWEEPATEWDYDHRFMSAGEEACRVLCDLLPDKYEPTGAGMRLRPGAPEPWSDE